MMSDIIGDQNYEALSTDTKAQGDRDRDRGRGINGDENAEEESRSYGVRLVDVSVSYGSQVVLSELNLTLPHGSTLAQRST